MRGRYLALSILALATGVAGGIAAERYYFTAETRMGNEGPKVLYWVAPMDPNFRNDSPGKSPMGMDLIPVYDGQEASGDPAEVTLSGQEINAIGVRTAIAQVSDISHRIETVGFVSYDEQRTAHIHTRVTGWIETLDVRSVGERVKEGDRLFQMFSQEFAIASFDFINIVQTGNQRAIESARSKLRSHGASERQIDEIAKSGKRTRMIDIYAPQDGVVVDLEAAEGMYLQPGIQAVSLTDLSTVWLIVDVFERDIGRLTEDMTAIASFDHLPGKIFEGTIEYFYPSLDASTRTLPVRLRFENAERLLKPNMFGKVSLIPQETRTAITVPSEAIIRTGRAERVIIKTGEGTFKPRLVTTGLRNSFGEGGRTEIVQGLNVGEQVVASAQFLIDSESSLSAGLMRMAPTDQEPALGAGTLVAIDTSRRVATIQHDMLDSLDWPAMQTDFPIAAEINIDRLKSGMAVAFRIARGADGVLSVLELGPDDGVAATGTGMVKAVTSDGKLTLAHDAIPDIGWPPMQMDMTVAGFDPETVPLDQPVEFDLSKTDDGNFTIVAVRPVSEGGSASDDNSTSNVENGDAMSSNQVMSPILVSGTINSVDAAARMANITHGPMADIGMPGMTMDFKIDPALDANTLVSGTEMILKFDRPDRASIVLAGTEPIAKPMTVSGTINTINSDARTANITHGPMTDIGMPGMTMNFAISPDLRIDDLPLEAEVMLLFSKNADFSLTLVGLAEEKVVTQ